MTLLPHSPLAQPWRALPKIMALYAVVGLVGTCGVVLVNGFLASPPQPERQPIMAPQPSPVPVMDPGKTVVPVASGLYMMSSNTGKNVSNPSLLDPKAIADPRPTALADLDARGSRAPPMGDQALGGSTAHAISNHIYLKNKTLKEELNDDNSLIKLHDFAKSPNNSNNITQSAASSKHAITITSKDIPKLAAILRSGKDPLQYNLTVSSSNPEFIEEIKRQLELK